MRIDKITLTEFGALKNRTFTLKDGINIFEGQNESGKSTVVSFIRFMLYGMPKKTASQELSDRERWLSWDGLTASGSMEITVPDGSYRIERRFQLNASTAKSVLDECKIFDLSTGAEVFEGELPGKKFLGITPDVYDSTACVKQLECSKIDGTSVRSSIENLILSADEKIDTQKAQALLDKHRKVLLYKNAKGGLIYESELKKAELSTALAKAKEDAEVIISKQNAIAHLLELEEGHLASAKGSEEKIRIYEACVILKRFNDLHAEEDKVYSLQSELKKLTESRGFNDTLPDRHLLEEFDASERALRESADALKMANGELHNAEASPCGDRILAAIHEKAEQNGGKKSLLSKVFSLIKKQKSAKVLATLLYVFGALFALVGGLGFALPLIPKFTLALLIIGAYAIIPTAYQLYALIAFSAIGVLFIALAITRSVAASKKKKQRISLFAAYGLNTKTAEPAQLEKHLDSCAESYKLCVQHDAAYQNASAKVASAKSVLEARLSESLKLLDSTSTAHTDDTPESILLLLKERREELAEVCSIKEELEIELKSRQGTALSIKGSLDEYDETKLRESIPAGTDVEEIATTTNITDLKRRYDFSNGQYNSTMERRIAFEKELVAVSATAQDPAKLDAEYNEVCRVLEEGRRNFDALVMASNAIDAASDSIRKNVTPTIRNQASALIGKLTAGKYSEIGLDADLDINVTVGGSTKSIDAMSKGTRDAAYISLRMALVALICSENPPPLIFDEGFSLLDDDRTKNMLTMLYAYTQHDGQCLLFTCHKRETEILGRIGNFNHVIL